jgi:pimeloyl-ACP methyl ester carboxylesterase
MPVMFVVGERDTKFRAIAAQMLAESRAAQVVVVPGVGHAVHLEAPEAVAALVTPPD